MTDAPKDESSKKSKKLHSLKNVKQYYNEYALHYDTDPYYEDHLYDDLTWYFIEPYLPTDKTTPILDIGGGTGKWAVKLAEMGFKVICADISEEMLKIAKQKTHNHHLDHLISFKELDIRDMHDYPDESFNLVLAVGDIISYALDDDVAVAECYRICKPGGRCIASVDSKLTYLINEINYNHIDRLEDLLKTGISGFFKKHDVKTYFPTELEDLFKRNHFYVEKIAGKPVLSVWLSKKEKRQKLTPNYDLILKLEKELADKPHFIGHGGHLQIIAKKPF